MLRNVEVVVNVLRMALTRLLFVSHTTQGPTDKSFVQPCGLHRNNDVSFSLFLKRLRYFSPANCLYQVAYTGLLQMFLTPRAVTLLVCNTEAFGQREDCSIDSDLLQQDLSKIQELRVCDWLRSLSFRIPDSDVIVVATKCDRASWTAVDMAERMERSIRKWLHIWSGSGMTTVRVEDGVSLTSCATSTVDERGGATLRKRKQPRESMWTCDWRQDTRDEPLPSLLYRVMYNNRGHIRGAALVLPRSWNIALIVLDALGNGRRVRVSLQTYRMLFPPSDRPWVISFGILGMSLCSTP